MRVKNFVINEIDKSSLSPFIKKYKIENTKYYDCLYGNFFIDGHAFLPIELSTLSTSLDLFTCTSKIKFKKYFTNKLFQYIEKSNF